MKIIDISFSQHKYKGRIQFSQPSKLFFGCLLLFHGHIIIIIIIYVSKMLISSDYTANLLSTVLADIAVTSYLR